MIARAFTIPNLLHTAPLWLVLLLGLYLGAGAYAANRCSRAEHLSTPDTPLTYGMRYEDVTFPARQDGLKIAAWYIPVEGQSAQASPAVVLVHGWNSSRTVGFNKHFLDMAKALHQASFAVLMIDLRGHGESAPARYSAGIYERRDVLGAVDYLLGRGHQPGRIGLLGTSLGASASLGAAVQEPAVGALVADSLFADCDTVMKTLWRLRNAPMPKSTSSCRKNTTVK